MENKHRSEVNCAHRAKIKVKRGYSALLTILEEGKPPNANSSRNVSFVEIFERSVQFIALTEPRNGCHS